MDSDKAQRYKIYCYAMLVIYFILWLMYIYEMSAWRNLLGCLIE
ncbi:MAG: hypothetical protein ABH952_02605 [Candidatus Omnitrophota bacterium]